jgi:hypothetical protein
MKKVLLFAASCFLLACNDAADNTTATNDSSGNAMTSKESKNNPVDFADMKYADISRTALEKFSRGDLDGWLTDFAENAVYIRPNGDSVVGKAAITNFWKERWKVIDSISFSNQIYLPVDVHQTQANEAAGIWSLTWYVINAKYKNGVKANIPAHQVSHFDANGKIDRFVHYFDTAPIQSTMAKQ